MPTERVLGTYYIIYIDQRQHKHDRPCCNLEIPRLLHQHSILLVTILRQGLIYSFGEEGMQLP